MSSMVWDHTFQAIEDTGSESKKSTQLFAKVFNARGTGSAGCSTYCAITRGGTVTALGGNF